MIDLIIVRLKENLGSKNNKVERKIKPKRWQKLKGTQYQKTFGSLGVT